MSDAWQYCENLSDPEAVKKLAQAALQAFLTLKEALQDRDVDPERFATLYDWPGIQAQLHAALKAAGHPAGDLPSYLAQGGIVPR